MYVQALPDRVRLVSGQLLDADSILKNTLETLMPVACITCTYTVYCYEQNWLQLLLHISMLRPCRRGGGGY